MAEPDLCSGVTGDLNGYKWKTCIRGMMELFFVTSYEDESRAGHIEV